MLYKSYTRYNFLFIFAEIKFKIMAQKKIETIIVKFEDELFGLKHEVQLLAKKEHRTMSGLIRKLLSEYVEQQKNKDV